jgi:hypothetical protein
MLHIATADGQTVRLRQTVLTAHSGDHRGHAFRIDDVTKINGRHVVKATRKHRTGRHTIKVAPEIFRLVITEIEETLRKIKTRVVTTWAKIDEGLYMGTLALIPLAYFEHYELADKIVEFFHTLF